PVDVVHPDVAADEEARQVLHRLGIEPVDPIGELEGRARAAQAGWDHDAWTSFWHLARLVGANRAKEVMQRHLDARRLRVLTKAGTFRRLNQTLLPGPVVPADGTRDAAVTIDMTFHGDDIDLLRD